MERIDASPPASPASKPSIRVPRWIDTILLLVGLALLGYVLSRYPLAEIGRACLRLGPAVALTPVIALGWISCNTSALHLLLGQRVGWLHLLRIRLIGDGYNALLPLAGLGGEPFKVKHLAAIVPMDRVLTALIRDRLIENAVGLLFTGFWLAVAIGHFTVGPTLRVAILGYVAFAAVFGVGSVLVMVTSLPSRLSVMVARWIGIPSQRAVMLPPMQLVRVLGWYLAARVVGLLESAVLLWLLGLGFDPLTILLCYSLHNAAGFIGFAIPAGIGVFEGTTVYLFSMLRFPGPAGVAFALARRGRMLLVGLVGVMLHLLLGGVSRRPARAGEPPAAAATAAVCPTPSGSGRQASDT